SRFLLLHHHLLGGCGVGDGERREQRQHCVADIFFHYVLSQKLGAEHLVRSTRQSRAIGALSKYTLHARVVVIAVAAARGNAGEHACRYAIFTGQWAQIQETPLAQELTSAAERERLIDPPVRVGLHLLLSHCLLARPPRPAPISFGEDNRRLALAAVSYPAAPGSSRFLPQSRPPVSRANLYSRSICFRRAP